MDDRTADESMSVIVEQMRVHLMRLRRGAEVEEAQDIACDLVDGKRLIECRHDLLHQVVTSREMAVDRKCRGQLKKTSPLTGGVVLDASATRVATTKHQYHDISAQLDEPSFDCRLMQTVP
jgi:hypothetical protein